MPPKEFTPEITEDFYKRLSSRIGQRGAVDEGRAHSEALSRGRTDDPYYLGAAIGQVRQGVATQQADLDASLSYDVAGLGREERLTKEGRAYDSAEADKDREFRERMARQYQSFMADQGNTDYRRGYQSQLWQIPLQGAARGGGYAMGKGLF